MSALTRAKSPETKLITLYNMNLDKNQSYQSYRVQSNTTIFDLITHLQKHNENKQIELFIYPNQLYEGNLNAYLYPILQQGSIRTISFRVVADKKLFQTQTPKSPNQNPISENYPVKSQYNYIQQNQQKQNWQQIEIEQQNQSQFSQNQQQKSYQNGENFLAPEIFIPQSQLTISEQVLELKQENLRLQKELTNEKQLNIQLQQSIMEERKTFQEKVMQLTNQVQIEQNKNKLQQSQQQTSQRDSFEQFTKLKALLEKEKAEKEELIQELRKQKSITAEALKRSQMSSKPFERESIQKEDSSLKKNFLYETNVYSSPFGERLSSTSYMDQSRMMFTLTCSHQLRKNELEQILVKAMSQQRGAQCNVCSKQISLSISRLLGTTGETYIDFKCKLDLSKISRTLSIKKEYLKCSNINCTFFCLFVESTGINQGFCPLCLQYSISNPFKVIVKQEFQRPESFYTQQRTAAQGSQNQSEIVVSQNKGIKIQELTTAMPCYQNYSSSFKQYYQHRR